MTDIVGNRNFRDIWEERVFACPDKEFMVFEDIQGSISKYTYAQFNIEVNKTANTFIELGIKKGDKVVVHMNNCPEFLMCWFGLAKIGAIIVPINIKNSKEDCEYIIDYCKAIAIITEKKYYDVIYQSFILDKVCCRQQIILARTVEQVDETLNLTEFNNRQSSELTEVREIQNGDDFEILFTSGTTAKPKGALFTHYNAIYAGIISTYQFMMREDDRMLSVMPGFHVDFQFSSVMPVIYTGATLVMLEKYSATKFWRQVRYHQATLTQGVSTIMHTMMLQPPDPSDQDHCVRKLMYFINLPEKEKCAFENRFKVNLINSYGLSETVNAVTVDPIYGQREGNSVGRPFISWEIKIVDENENEVDCGSVGEIWVKGIPGKTLMKEYYNDEESTRKTMTSDGWLRTGDNGYMDADGWLYFVDRKKYVIKCKGENISASEIEWILLEHPKISEAAVVGVCDLICGEAVKAVVVLKRGEDLSKEDILAYCRQRMADFRVPSLVEFRSRMPLTCTGKIDKKALK